MVQDLKILYTRKRLNKVLPKVWEYPLTLVKAPVGYGKTTAVLEYSKSCKAEVLWQTVFDSSVISFWNGFSHLFDKFDPTCAKCLVQLGISGDTMFIEEAVELLGAIKFPQKTLLVIDDYHLLLSEVTDRFFERLAKEEIPGLHIVIVSRNNFGKNTNELLLKGYCLIIDKKYFELTCQETVEYCKMCGISIKTQEAAKLHSYTEGWITAVYLCTLGYRRNGQNDWHFISLHELIETLIYQPYSTEIKNFMVIMSIFDGFSLPQAEYMWRKGDAENLLLRLTTENAFITFDYARKTYCMHNILVSFLRKIFNRYDENRRRACWKMAGEWYLKIGDYGRSMECFYQAADFDQLLTAFEAVRGAAFARQMRAARIKYFQECPPETKKKHPLAGLIYAYSLFVTNEMKLLARQVEESEEVIKNISPEVDEQTRLNLMGELEVLKGIIAYNDFIVMDGHFKTAAKLLDRPSSFISPQNTWTFGSPSALCLYYRKSGEMETLVKTVKKEISHYYQIANGHGSGAEYVIEAEWYYYIGDFENAKIIAHKALYIAQSKQQMSIILCAKFVLIRLALAGGDWNYVRDTLRQMKERIKEQTSYMYIYVYTLDMCKAFVFSCLKQINKLPAWIYQKDLPDAVYFPNSAFVNVLWCKTLLLSGQYHKLAGIAGPLIDSAAIFPNLLAQVYIYIFAASAWERLGCREKALAMLQKALDIAVPDNVIMPFVENREYVADLFSDLQTNGIYREFIDRVCKTCPDIDLQWQAISVNLDNDDPERLLTEREKEIVELVVRGMSNDVIGKNLNIAKDTVKKALHNIFVKLGVKNRMALARKFLQAKN